MSRLDVTHTDGTRTTYLLGPDGEYRAWRCHGHGLVLYRHDGTRTHVLAGSMLSVDVHPGGTA